MRADYMIITTGLEYALRVFSRDLSAFRQVLLLMQVPTHELQPISPHYLDSGVHVSRQLVRRLAESTLASAVV